MRKEIEIRMSTDTTVHREYANVGFLGACLKLWRFWRRNGTHLDDYDEFGISVLNSEFDRMKDKLASLKAREDSVSPDTRRKALEKLLEDSNK